MILFCNNICSYVLLTVFLILNVSFCFLLSLLLDVCWCGLFLCVCLCVCSCSSLCVCVCVCQIVGNGSEQQLQRELEDVLMDPSVADTGPGSEAAMDSLGGADHGLLPSMASPVAPGSDPLSAPPPKLEMVLPVQTAQESELNERSYRGESFLILFFVSVTMALIFSFMEVFPSHSG